jgi:pimeloyl-ACP methyl ester carboxylesterase
MTSVQQGTLRVPGASLFYRSCGRGAPLLIVAGGEADADMTEPLRDALAAQRRVITYDRRGLSRSVIDPGASRPGVGVHADDAHRLLVALTDEPADVFGAGIGGLVGLDLLARYPEQVRLLVAHEAPSAELLADKAQNALAEAQLAVLEALQAGDVTLAMTLNAELAGVDPEDREPDVAPPATSAQRDENMRVLLSSDIPRAIAYRIDLPALDVQARKIVPAAGQSTRRTPWRQCAAALAEVLERPLVEFPGGHTGWLLRPKAFAAQLSETFATVDRPDRRLGDSASPRRDGRQP